ncbi:MAG: hypothetical protein Q4B96_03855, partial [Bacillota bacterium]|nr:hypothetical protein [Bacillota bacterium]
MSNSHPFTSKPIGRSLLFALLALLIFFSSVAYLLLTPCNVISLDINPSIELETNRIDRVVSINALNADGEELLAGYTPRDRDLDEVIEDLVDRMIFKGYIAPGLQNDILITVRDTNSSEHVLDKVNTSIADYVEQRQMQVQLYAQQFTGNDKLQELAAGYQVSAGKMELIRRLLNGDPTLSIDELTTMRISDIIAYATANNIPLPVLDDMLDDLDDIYGDDRFDDIFDDDMLD